MTSPVRQWRTVAPLLAVLVVGHAPPAAAHLVSTELGPFYDGAAHPLVSPQDLLIIIGLTILAAYAGTAQGRRLVVSLSLAWAAGVAAGFGLMNGPWDMPTANAVVVLLLGVLGLLKFGVPGAALPLAAVIIGFLRGLMNGSAARLADGTWLSVLGVACGVFILVAVLSGVCAWLVRRRFEVVLRVAGSWIAAISLLMLGWHFRA